MWLECVGNVAICEEFTGDRKRLSVVSLRLVSLSMVSLRVVTLTVVGLRVVGLSVVRLSVVTLGVISLRVVSLDVMSLRVVTLSVMSLGVVSLGVVRLRVVVFFRVVVHLQDPALRRGQMCVHDAHLERIRSGSCGRTNCKVDVHNPCLHILPP